ncbi:MAG: type III pantothenate kinase [Proteobacteria bacterium]|nr:type III pantothenate kinase [Pseudomonadota bacterium]
MLLAIDIGNTRASIGLFAGTRLMKRGSIDWPARPSVRAIEQKLNAFAGKGAHHACIASVVPRLTPIFAAACRKASGTRPLIVTPRNAGVRIKGYNIRQLGIDRLLAAAAAHRRHRRAVIVIDAGTAMTIDLMTARGEFAGGVILPGIGSSARGLGEIAARLPCVPPSRARRVVAKNTRDAIRAGLFFGYAGLIERIVERMVKESRARPLVVATGGDAALIKRACPIVARVHPDLVLEGLMISASGLFLRRLARSPRYSSRKDR